MENKKDVILLTIGINLVAIVIVIVTMIFAPKTTKKEEYLPPTKDKEYFPIIDRGKELTPKIPEPYVKEADFKEEDTSNYIDSLKICSKRSIEYTEQGELYKYTINRFVENCTDDIIEIPVSTAHAELATNNSVTVNNNIVIIDNNIIKVYKIKENKLYDTGLSTKEYDIYLYDDTENVIEDGDTLIGLVLGEPVMENEEYEYYSLYLTKNKKVYGYYNFIECMDEKCNNVYLGNKTSKTTFDINVLIASTGTIKNIDNQAKPQTGCNYYRYSSYFDYDYESDSKSPYIYYYPPCSRGKFIKILDDKFETIIDGKDVKKSTHYKENILIYDDKLKIYDAKGNYIKDYNNLIVVAFENNEKGGNKYAIITEYNDLNYYIITLNDLVNGNLNAKKKIDLDLPESREIVSLKNYDTAKKTRVEIITKENYISCSYYNIYEGEDFKLTDTIDFC